MSNVLHITNGDSAVELLKEGGMLGTIIPWRDVLHMGPVPTELELDKLSKIRADYLSSLGWGQLSALQHDFETRDAYMHNAHQYERVILWFEHDLYDQLQLLQILSWFNDHPLAEKPRDQGRRKPARLARDEDVDHAETDDQHGADGLGRAPLGLEEAADADHEVEGSRGPEEDAPACRDGMRHQGASPPL